MTRQSKNIKKTKIKKIRKTKINKQNYNIQAAGNFENVAHNIDKFIDIINSKDVLKVDSRYGAEFDATGLSSRVINNYYSILYKYLPCADTVIKFKKIRTFEFSYDKEKNITFTKHTDITFEDKYQYDNNIITIYYDRSIIKVNLVIDVNNTYRICGEGVRLILMKHTDQAQGHASVLYLNYEQHTFSFIDPNGDDFSCKTQNQLVVNALHYILNESYLYNFSKKLYEHVCLKLEKCQLKSASIPDSCLLWSLLFMDLILRFGIQQTIEYINTKICHTSKSTSMFMLKYANYILECLNDDYTKLFIYDPYYIESVKLLDEFKKLIKQNFEFKIKKFYSIIYEGIHINLNPSEQSIFFRYYDLQTISFEINMEIDKMYDYYHEFSTYFKKIKGFKDTFERLMLNLKEQFDKLKLDKLKNDSYV